MSEVCAIDAARNFQRNKLKRKQDALDVRFEETSRDFNAICQMII